MSAASGVLVLAKAPVPGRVKTRLCPPLTPRAAASVAAAALADTMDTVDAVQASRTLCFDGAVGVFRRPGWRVTRQRRGGLDVRLAHAFGESTGPTLLIGMDTPQLDAQELSAFDSDRYDACLGPTDDGGYWTIGLRDPRGAQAAIVGIPMSTPYTFAAQHERLVALGMRVQTLPPHIDVDTADDAQRVAASIPLSRFAAAFDAARSGECA